MSDASEGFDRRTLLSRAGRGALLVPAGGGLSLLLSACGEEAPGGGAGGGGGGGAGGETVAQTYTTPLGFIFSFVEAYVADREGFWNKHKLDVTIRGGQGTAPALQSVLGGSAQYSRPGGVSTIVAIANEGSPLINIATAYQRSQFAIASVKSKAITGPQDFEGKRIGVVSSGGTTENLLQIMAANAGVPFDSISRPVVGVGGAAYQLAKDGKVDGWVALDTDLANLRAKGAEITSFNTDEFGFVPADSYALATDTLKSKGEAARRFLAGIRDAMEFAMEPANADKVIAAAKHFDPSLAEDQAARELPIIVENWRAAGADQVLSVFPEKWEEGQRNLVKAGLVKKAVPVERLVDPSVLESVKRG